MGEVYRASNPRLKRDLAIKLLPSAFSSDAERLRRFELEAHAAGALNHPNILTNADIGSHDNSPYVVSELLEGETLREMVNIAVNQRKAIDYALQSSRACGCSRERNSPPRPQAREHLYHKRRSRKGSGFRVSKAHPIATSYRFDPSTARKEVLKEILPADAACIWPLNSVLMTPDGKGIFTRLGGYIPISTWSTG